MFAVHLERDPPVRPPSHLVDRQPLALERMKHREIPREHVNAQPFFGRRNIMQEAAERRVTIAGSFRRELHAAVDIPAEDEHHAWWPRDRLRKDRKIIRAVDQRAKTISLPNAVAIAARLKNAAVLMRPPGSNGFSNGLVGRKKR